MVLHISSMSSEVPPRLEQSEAKRDLSYKLKILRIQLSSLQPSAGHCKLEISRQEIFEVCIFAPGVFETCLLH